MRPCPPLSCFQGSTVAREASDKEKVESPELPLHRLRAAAAPNTRTRPTCSGITHTFYSFDFCRAHNNSGTNPTVDAQTARLIKHSSALPRPIWVHGIASYTLIFFQLLPFYISIIHFLAPCTLLVSPSRLFLLYPRPSTSRPCFRCCSGFSSLCLPSV